MFSNEILNWSTELDAEDVKLFGLWTISCGSIFFVLLRQQLPLSLKVALLLAVAAQGTALGLDLFDDGEFSQHGPNALLSWIYVCSNVFSMAAYQLSFQYLMKATANGSAVDIYERLLWQLFNFFQSGAGSPLSVAWSRLEFGFWRLKYPQSSFAEFYSGSIARKIKRGKAHRTLGKRRFLRGLPFLAAPEQSTDTFSARGRALFLELRDLGVQPDHVCVDYGCGSLRIGQQLIEYLEPNKYWGLDLIEDFYKAGLELLPPNTVSKKNPQFRVISSDILKEVSGQQPDYVISTAVLQHVPPEELNQFIGNVLQLRSSRTIIAVFYNESETVIRTDGKNWAYDQKTLLKSIRIHSATAQVKFIPRANRKFKRRGTILMIQHEE